MRNYSTIQAHRSMVFDTIRNKAYLKAINQAVTSDSIVMDLSTRMEIHWSSATTIVYPLGYYK